MTFSERFSEPYILKPGDHQAGVSGDSINMGSLHRFRFSLLFGALTGDAVLTLSSGASEGTETTSETFRYRVANAVQGSASGDIFAAWANSSALTLTAADYQNRKLVVEIESDQLTDGQPWLTLVLSSAASALNVAVDGIGEPRFSAVTALTVIK